MIVGSPTPIRIPLCVYKECRHISFLNQSLVICAFPNSIITFNVYVNQRISTNVCQLMYVSVFGEGIVHPVDFCLTT